MSPELSVVAVLEQLEAQIAFHREQEALHAEKEEAHRGQRSFHAAELERITRHFEEFKAVAGPALELARQALERRKATEPHPEPEEVETFYGKRPMVSRLVARVVDGKPADAAFGATEVAAEVNRRFGRSLDWAVDARAASVTLRRMERAGHIHLVRQGRAFHESLYSKQAPRSQPG
jgi:hypothetical protein